MLRMHTGGRVGVAAALAVAAFNGQHQAAEPGAVAVLVLPNVGQLVYQPHGVMRARAGEIVGTVAAGEINVAVGGNGYVKVGQQRHAAVDFDAAVVDAV